jgi:rRNA maturation protein Rpf1
MLLITTCRKPCTNTRLFARNLSNLVPGAEYVPRGKKNIYSLIEEARKKGLRRVAIISDFKGNPGEVEFIKLDKREWDWAETVFRIKSVDYEKSKKKIKDIKVEGGLGEMVVELFDIEESTEPEMTLTADKGIMKFGDQMNIKLEIYKNSEE